MPAKKRSATETSTVTDTLKFTKGAFYQELKGNLWCCANARTKKVGDESLVSMNQASTGEATGMARKFLQMGCTRARLYANHKGGRKHDKTNGMELPRIEDKQKAEAAAIFYERYVAARQHEGVSPTEETAPGEARRKMTRTDRSPFHVSSVSPAELNMPRANSGPPPA
jgi:hypothetical protein